MNVQDSKGWLKKQLDIVGIKLMLEGQLLGAENNPAPEERIGSSAHAPPLLSLPGLTLEATAPVFAILDNWRVSSITSASLK